MLFYDDFYGVNFVNNGFYGDVIMEELILEIELWFCVICEFWVW